jgi:hypothetical protein
MPRAVRHGGLYTGDPARVSTQLFRLGCACACHVNLPVRQIHKTEVDGEAKSGTLWVVDSYAGVTEVDP